MKRLLIFYSHFPPAFKAGGPVQSLANFVERFKNDFSIYVFCSACDLGDNELLKNINPDEWNEYNNGTKVFYASHSLAKAVTRVFKEVNPDTVYINGMFLPFYNWLPLWLGKQQQKRVILAPRGMLQRGALEVKPLKKKLFLLLFKFVGLHKNVIWHATDVQERDDVIKIFGTQSKVKIAANIPKSPLPAPGVREKKAGELKLVYLSLITQKKRLDFILDVLKQITTPVVFDIYGPLVDPEYWSYCQSKMNNTIHQITYQGLVSPENVQSVLANYHAFILPTKGENFGHAIYESLSVGTPVIVSQYTPWIKLQDTNAGVTVYSENISDWETVLKKFVELNNTALDVLVQGAHTLAQKYFEENNIKNDYLDLFQ